MRRQVRVAAFSYEGPAQLTRSCGDLLMACSDYPHSEGAAELIGPYEQAGLDRDADVGVFGDNVAWLLGLE